MEFKTRKISSYGVVVLNLYSECPRGHPYFVGEVKIILTIAINLWKFRLPLYGTVVWKASSWTDMQSVWC